jgi:hypothetical protein
VGRFWILGDFMGVIQFSWVEVGILITLVTAAYTLGQIMSKKQDKTVCSSRHDKLYENMAEIRKDITSLGTMLAELNVKLEALQREIDIMAKLDSIEKRLKDGQA